MKTIPTPAPVALNAATTAQLLALSESRCHQIAREGRLEKVGRGKFSLESVARFLQREREAVSGELKDAELRAAKLRKAVADAELAEFQVARETRRVVLASEVGNRWIQSITAAKTRLLSLPARLGPQAVIQPSAQAATELIDREMRAALTELGDNPPDE